MFLEEFNNVYSSLLDHNRKYNFRFKPKLTLGDNGVFTTYFQNRTTGAERRRGDLKAGILENLLAMTKINPYSLPPVPL